MNRNRISSVFLCIVALFFLGVAIVVWIYGPVSNRSIDALLLGIGALVYFILALYMFQKGGKESA